MRHTIRGIQILYEDPDVIVIAKEAGLIVQEPPGRKMYTVERALSSYVRKGQLRSHLHVYLVHRLDRETSGVMMVAKTREVQEYFRSNWNEITEKTYLARVEGSLKEDEGTFESYLAEDEKGYKVRSVPENAGGRLAKSVWRALARDAHSTLVQVMLHTGRRNQIRVHFSEAGHPIVGDVKYGARQAKRLFLHAWKLSFIHPHSHKKVTFEVPPEPIFGLKV